MSLYTNNGDLAHQSRGHLIFVWKIGIWSCGYLTWHLENLAFWMVVSYARDLPLLSVSLPEAASVAFFVAFPSGKCYLEMGNLSLTCILYRYYRSYATCIHPQNPKSHLFRQKCQRVYDLSNITNHFARGYCFWQMVFISCRNPTWVILQYSPFLLPILTIHWIGLRENFNRKPMGFYHERWAFSG